MAALSSDVPGTSASDFAVEEGARNESEGPVLVMLVVLILVPSAKSS